MSSPSATSLSKPARRRALALGYLNGALWAIGNGLTTGALVTYLAMDLGAKGLGLSLILAAPALVGLLRLAGPVFIRRLGTSKRACLTFSFASYVLIWVLPAVGLPELVPRRAALGLLVALLCVHQLLEYLGIVALWGWLAEIVPGRIRGRYFARRQIYQLAVLIPTLLTAGAFTDAWKEHYQQARPGWLLLGYAIPTAAGAACLMASLVPLVLMPPVDPLPTVRPPRAWQEMLVPLADRRFWPLLLFGCWVSLFNGIMQAPQSFYPKAVLGLGVGALAAMRVAMQLGQMGVSRWAGPFSDRYGNRPAMVASQVVLSAAPLFFLLSSAAQPWWLAGAWLAWSFYAGLNICLPNLMLKLAPPGTSAAYIATYFGITSVFYALSTLAGGVAFDGLAGGEAQSWLARWGLDRFDLAFWVAWGARTFAVVLVALIIEPGAKRWREIVA